MNNFDIIEQNIKTRGEISPLLFLWSSGEVFHARLLGYLQNLLKENHIDTQSLFHLEDNGESLKIEEVKKFISSSEMRPRFAFQIFFIENISRMTQQSQNACLKFFEEPWEGNIVILTSQSEAWILETILSRVSVYSVNASQKLTKNEFYYSMILSHAEQSSNECIQYFFSWKYEKSEYIWKIISRQGILWINILCC